MKKRMRLFVAGAVIIAVIATGITVFASAKSIEAIFKNIKISINGKQINNMDTEPFIYGSRTFVPVRFVAENLGMAVNYNNATDTVEITGNTAAPDTNKNKLKLYFYFRDLKEVIDDLETVNNTYVEKTNQFPRFHDTAIFDNIYLTQNLESSLKTLLNAIPANYSNIDDFLTADGTTISKADNKNLLSNVNDAVSSTDSLISYSNFYVQNINLDNKNSFDVKCKDNINKIASVRDVINKYYTQLSSDLNK